MGEILAVGITHYPPLAGSDETMVVDSEADAPEPASAGKFPHCARMAGSDARRMGQRRRHHRRAGASRAPGAIAAQGARANRRVSSRLHRGVGDDQYENFREDVIPPYCIYAHESFEFAPPAHNVWNDCADKKFHAAGNVAAAKYLAGGLIEAGFDTAYSYKPLHHPLGHAFANAVLYLRLRVGKVSVSDHSIRDKLLRA